MTSFIVEVLPSSPTILHTNTIARNKSWVLRWSAVYSEGHLVKTYTVWHQLWHIVKDNMTRKESWLRENITGFVYREELAADTRYLFAVTAWNKWGESELEIDKILNISTKFTDAFTHQIERTTNLLGMNDCESQKWVACDDALSLYLCNLFSGGGHDTFLLQITCKKARIWTFFLIG